MKCMYCGNTLEVTKEVHRYAENDGLDVLLEGVSITSCPECGEQGVVIPRISQLNEALARAIAQRPQKLEPAEIRFLRKYLGWSGKDFAHRMGVTPETISRWENGARPMGSTAEILLRLLAIELRPVDEYPVPDLVERKRTKPMMMQLGKDWVVVA